MNLAHTVQKMGNVGAFASKFSSKCEESLKTTEIVDF